MTYNPIFDLPSLAPNVYPGLPFFEIVRDKFLYSFTSDEETFNAWKIAAQNPNVYWSSGDAIVKADKFSEFMIIWKCTTAEQGDGCCMISEEDGALCLVR